MLRTCTNVGMPPCIDHVCCVVWPVSSSWCGSGRCTTSTTDPVLQVDPPTLSSCAHPCAGPHVSTRSYSMLGWTRCYGSCFGKTCVLHKRTSWKRKCTSWEYDVVLPGWGVRCSNLNCPGPLVLEAGMVEPCHPCQPTCFQGHECGNARGSERRRHGIDSLSS